MDYNKCGVSMKKFIIISLAIVAFTVAGVTVYLNRIVEHAIEHFGTEFLGTEIAVDSVSVSPFSGKAELSGITVANMPGFNAPHMFSLDKVELGIKLGSLKTATVEIDQIRFVEPIITYEMNPQGINLVAAKNEIAKKGAELQQNSGVVSGNEETTQEPTKPSKNIAIKHLEITKPSLQLTAVILQQTLEKDLTLADIILNNIGTNDKGGVTIANASDQVIQAIQTQIVQSGATAQGLDFDSLAPSSGSDAVDATMGAVESVKELGEGLIEGIVGSSDER